MLFPVQGGAYQICDILADKIGREKVLLNQPVVRIEQVNNVNVYHTLDEPV